MTSVYSIVYSLGGGKESRCLILDPSDTDCLLVVHAPATHLRGGDSLGHGVLNRVEFMRHEAVRSGDNVCLVGKGGVLLDASVATAEVRAKSRMRWSHVGVEVVKNGEHLQMEREMEESATWTSMHAGGKSRRRSEHYRRYGKICWDCAFHSCVRVRVLDACSARITRPLFLISYRLAHTFRQTDIVFP